MFFALLLPKISGGGKGTTAQSSGHRDGSRATPSQPSITSRQSDDSRRRIAHPFPSREPVTPEKDEASPDATSSRPSLGSTATGPPPPYLTSRRLPTPATQGPPTTGQLRNRKHKSKLWTGRETNKVSMLPLVHPSKDGKWITDYPNPGTPVQKRTNVARRLGTHLATKTLKKNRDPLTFHYHDEDGREVPFSFLDGIGVGEVERTLDRDTYDWTQDWAWKLTMQNWDAPGNEHRVWGHFYFNDLSDLLIEKVSWNNAQLMNPLSTATEMESSSHTHPPWSRNWRFREPSSSPRWAATVLVRHQDSGALNSAGTPWGFINLRSSFLAEIDQRTGAGKHKKLVWYYTKREYGNDILGQPVESWEERHVAEFEAFISRIMPYKA